MLGWVLNKPWGLVNLPQLRNFCCCCKCRGRMNETFAHISPFNHLEGPFLQKKMFTKNDPHKQFSLYRSEKFLQQNWLGTGAYIIESFYRQMKLTEHFEKLWRDKWSDVVPLHPDFHQTLPSRHLHVQSQQQKYQNKV